MSFFISPSTIFINHVSSIPVCFDILFRPKAGDTCNSVMVRENLTYPIYEYAKWGTCHNSTNYTVGSVVAILNRTLAKDNKIETILPSQEYFE